MTSTRQATVRATLPCAWCGRLIQWDRIGRVEYKDGQVENVCGVCCGYRPDNAA